MATVASEPEGRPLWEVFEEEEAYQQRKAQMEEPPEQTEPDYA